ncbi:MAG: SDR family oxidoreductase [Symploca sp. SIO2D2]|nr:SDR family oxidoreductase [Symploca sp. SIO2D2]
MKVLVTGHRGYIGATLVPKLLAEGFQPIGMDSDLFRACNFGEPITEIPTISKDVRDACVEDFEGVEAVLHLAGLSNDPLGEIDPDLTYDINFKASVNLAKLAKKAGVRKFVFSSSCSTYGAGGEGLKTEESEFNPVTPYGKSKVMAEEEVSKLADDSFSPTYLRNATAYGVSSRLRFDLVVNNLTAWAYATGKVHLKSDGSAWRPLVHIDDISQAFIAVLKAKTEEVHNEAFNVGAPGENYRVREIAELVKAAVPNSDLRFADGAAADSRCYRVSFEKIMTRLEHYKPEWNVRKGIEQCLFAYRDQGVTLEQFEGPKYQRLAHIIEQMENGLIDSKLRFVAEAASTLNAR